MDAVPQTAKHVAHGLLVLTACLGQRHPVVPILILLRDENELPYAQLTHFLVAEVEAPKWQFSSRK